MRKAYLIGAATDDFARSLDGAVAYERSGTLDRAVAAAARDAAASGAAEPVVLLSPACASYDQFANFEARGDAFRAIVTSDNSRGHERWSHARNAEPSPIGCARSILGCSAPSAA